ncbi:MAG: cytochrome c biogenesis heme-transporting ATPase CcmA [Gammaproteobacteria bacterium]
MSAHGPLALVARDLLCIRGDEPVFEDLSFTARGGEIWQIVGANGAGKTSLLRVLAGLAPAAGGELFWRERAIAVGAESLRRDLSYLGHQAGITGFLSVRENLVYALRLAGAAPRLDVDAALAAVGLADHLAAPARRLSAGQRQRLALARFVASAKPLWIMDEPLTALDAAGRALVEHLLDAHARSGGLALVSTHQALAVDPARLHRYEFPTRIAA